MKIFIIQQLYIMLSSTKLEGLTIDEKYKVLNVARELKKVSKEFEDFIKDSQESIKDNKELNMIIEREATREIEIKIDKLGKTFDKLLEHNDWNVSQVLMLEENLK